MSKHDFSIFISLSGNWSACAIRWYYGNRNAGVHANNSHQGRKPLIKLWLMQTSWRAQKTIWSDTMRNKECWGGYRCSAKYNPVREVPSIKHPGGQPSCNRHYHLPLGWQSGCLYVITITLEGWKRMGNKKQIAGSRSGNSLPSTAPLQGVNSRLRGCVGGDCLSRPKRISSIGCWIPQHNHSRVPGETQFPGGPSCLLMHKRGNR